MHRRKKRARLPSMVPSDLDERFSPTRRPLTPEVEVETGSENETELPVHPIVPAKRAKKSKSSTAVDEG
jgi:hypothetical protein